MKIDGAQRRRAMQAAHIADRDRQVDSFVRALDKYLENDGLVIGSQESEKRFALWMICQGWKNAG